MTFSVLNDVSMRQDNTHADSLYGRYEVGNVDSGGKVTQERMAENDGSKVTEKKRQFFFKCR